MNHHRKSLGQTTMQQRAAGTPSTERGAVAARMSPRNSGTYTNISFLCAVMSSLESQGIPTRCGL